ncbi:MAG: hypothetical protein JXB15_17345 [Anaerolineales bacterium]|nr:hypothetical protein [Anaerolineales bacterium]
MLDDFRKQADDSFFEEPESEENLAPLEPARRRGFFMGMTPFQRFIIAMMLLAITCLLSTFCLLVSEKIVLPFM